MIPRNADREEGSASAFNFWFFVFNARASAAAPWAMFAAVAMGIQMLTPFALNSPASSALYIWWTPATTVGAYTAPARQEPMPNGRVIRYSTALSTPFSIQENTGPNMVSVRYPVASTVTSGVTNKSIISGTILCSFFSSMHMNQTAITTGITCPW